MMISVIKIEDDITWILDGSIRSRYEYDSLKKTLVIISNMKLRSINSCTDPYSTQSSNEYNLEAFITEKKTYLLGVNKSYVHGIMKTFDVLDIASSQNIIIHSTNDTDFVIVELYSNSCIVSVVKGRSVVYVKDIGLGLNIIFYEFQNIFGFDEYSVRKLFNIVNFEGEYYDYKRKIIIDELEITKDQVIDIVHKIMNEKILKNIDLKSEKIVVYSPYLNGLHTIIKHIYSETKVTDITYNLSVSRYINEFYKEKVKLIRGNYNIFMRIYLWLRNNM